jgi:hypothetical protein
LAGQLAHDCGNLLYNLHLQMEMARRLGEASAPGAHAELGNQGAMRKETDKLTSRLREWHQFRERFAPLKQTIDLTQMIESVAGELGERMRILVDVQSPDESVYITSYAGDVLRLCVLLVHNVLEEAPEADACAITMHTVKKAQSALFRLANVDFAHARLRGFPPTEGIENTFPPSLIVATCKSIAVRLDARIYLEMNSAGGLALVTEFPLELS